MLGSCALPVCAAAAAGGAASACMLSALVCSVGAAATACSFMSVTTEYHNNGMVATDFLAGL
jgi:hypothetical protein